VGKESRRSNRRNRLGRRRPSLGNVRASVVVAPESGIVGPSLTKEAELVRASILYADDVELVSINAELLHDVSHTHSSLVGNPSILLADLNDSELAKMGVGDPIAFRAQLPSLSAAAETGNWDEINVRWRRIHDEFSRNIDRHYGAAYDDILSLSGGRDLMSAVQRGLIYSVAPAIALRHDAGALYDRWVSRLIQLLESPGAMLVFDDRVSALTRELMDHQLVDTPPSNVLRSQEGAVGTGMIARLPVIPAAPIDELIDLRHDLRRPLSRYRAAVLRMAASLEAEAFSQAGADEIDVLWTRDVHPAISEIEDELIDHSLSREVAKSLKVSAFKLVTGGTAIFLALDHAESLEKLVNAAISAAGPVVSAVGLGANASTEHNRKMKRKEFYYLYAVNERLGA
jgi:hypothetical protein